MITWALLLLLIIPHSQPLLTFHRLTLCSPHTCVLSLIISLTYLNHTLTLPRRQIIKCISKPYFPAFLYALLSWFWPCFVFPNLTLVSHFGFPSSRVFVLSTTGFVWWLWTWITDSLLSFWLSTMNNFCKTSHQAASHRLSLRSLTSRRLSAFPHS